jgi:hypothetical protein
MQLALGASKVCKMLENKEKIAAKYSQLPLSSWTWNLLSRSLNNCAQETIIGNK